jgi:xylan 1,4-beta-xylosidase
MGSPKDLSPAQVAQLRDLTRDVAETDRAMRSGRDGMIEVAVPMNSNDVVLVKVERGKTGK